jgi:hypothetical protein
MGSIRQLIELYDDPKAENRLIKSIGRLNLLFGEPIAVVDKTSITLTPLGATITEKLLDTMTQLRGVSDEEFSKAFGSGTLGESIKAAIGPFRFPGT